MTGPLSIGIICPADPGGARGGAESVWAGLAEAIETHTKNRAEVVALPSPESNFVELIDSYRLFAQLDVSAFDVVITSKYPAWMIQHPRHVLYMFHPLRGLYDEFNRIDLMTRALHGLPRCDPRPEPDLAALQQRAADLAGHNAAIELLDDLADAVRRHGPDHDAFRFPGPWVRDIIVALDRVALSPQAVVKHACISRTVAERVGYFPPAVVPTVIYPPSGLTGFHCEPGTGFFTASRLDAPKRLDLLIEAMAVVEADIPLRIAGAGREADRLAELAADDPRIQLLGPLDDRALVDEYASALAVPFIPIDEDLGLITLEAMASSKPVITADDSGGPLEFVVNEVNGLVTQPSRFALGTALDRVAQNPDLAQRWGRAGQLRARRVTWASCVHKLLAGVVEQRSDAREVEAAARRMADRRSASGALSKRPLVMLQTFPVYDRAGGGKIRALEIARHLADDRRVDLVTLATPHMRSGTFRLAPDLVEYAIPQSEEHFRAEMEVDRQVPMPITDIMAAELIDLTPAYLERLSASLDGAGAAILSHPYLLSALDAVGWSGPVLYEAQDAESHIKDSVLPKTAIGDRLREITREVESATVERSALITTPSDADLRALDKSYHIPPGKAVVLPNGVNCGEIDFVTGEDRRDRRRIFLRRWSSVSQVLAGDPNGEERALAVFMGSWHDPNIEAAQHVFNLAARMPDVVFVCIGSHGDTFNQWRTPPNVVLTSTVPNVIKDSLLSAADVALNPMLSGAGTNLKLAEYMAAGAPTVSTRFGARGFAVKDGVHVHLADIDGFATAVRRILDNPPEADALAYRARRLVEKRYDWSVVVGQYAQAVDHIISSQSPSP